MTTTNRPAGLSARARALWDEVLDANEPNGADVALFTEALRALDEADAARAQIAKEGMVVADRTGGPKAHPLLDVEHRRRAFFAMAMKQLGLHTADDEPVVDRHGRGRPGPKPRRLRSAS